jgi:hypothetical protein
MPEAHSGATADGGPRTLLKPSASGRCPAPYSTEVLPETRRDGRTVTSGRLRHRVSEAALDRAALEGHTFESG